MRQISLLKPRAAAIARGRTILNRGTSFYSDGGRDAVSFYFTQAHIMAPFKINLLLTCPRY